MNHSTRALFTAGRIMIALFIVMTSWLHPQPILSVKADSGLTINPVTWNVIGLDSNSPATGPYRFPVGAKICSAAATTNVLAEFTWDNTTNETDIYLRSGSLDSITIPAIAAGKCAYAFFEVELNQASAPYDKTRSYHIVATDSTGAVSTTQPREVYVEHLISQNRNSVTGVKLDTVPVAAGGNMTLMVGKTYTIELTGGTATQGYNQFESFINFPNTIFQILSVETSYSADSNTNHVPNPNPSLYANACIWDNDPGSPTYRSCIGGDDKAGGNNVVTTYKIKIIAGAGTTTTLNTLLYDFSGSSYHYNADFSTSARTVSIVGPSSVTISKTFTPKAIAPGGTSTMTFRLTNPTTEAVTGVHFDDTLLGGLKVADPPGVTTTGCGAGAFSPALNKDDTALTFTGATINPNSICTIGVKVTAPAGTFPNTTGHLFINNTDDTGNTGSDTLTASSTPACVPNQIMANWTIPNGTTANPPDTAGGNPTVKATNVSTATLSALIPAKARIVTNEGSNDITSLEAYGFKNDGQYVDFVVDTSKYSGVSMTFYIKVSGTSVGPNPITVSYNSGSGFIVPPILTISNPTTTFALQTIDLTGLSSTTGNTTIRITGANANNDNQGAGFLIDDIKFTGCGIPTPAPTITKSFVPATIMQGATSTLGFTISNTASGNQPLTSVAFTDVLPAGLSVADSTSSQCGGSNNLTTTAATRTIALTGGVLAAGASCTFSVTVTGTAAGQFNNVTGFVSSTQSGVSINYASASLTVIAPPILQKSFAPASAFTGDAVTLTFVVTNPNLNDALSGIGFGDLLPAGLEVAGGTSSACGGTLTATDNAPARDTLVFSGGSLAANSTCTINVPLTTSSAGDKNNLTSAVTSTEGGSGNTASAAMVVADKAASIDLTKQISKDGVAGPWTSFVTVGTNVNIWYRFKVYNSGDVNFTLFNVADPLLAGTGADPAACAWKDVANNPFVLPLKPGDTAYCVKGPVSTAADAGIYPNTATLSGTSTNGVYPLNPKSTAMYANPSLKITKDVDESYFSAENDTLNYTFTVKNDGFAPLPGPVTVTDDKLGTVACQAVTLVGDLDNYLDVGETVNCPPTGTASYTVTGPDVANQKVTNNAYGSAAGVNSPTVVKTVPQAPDLIVAKSNDTSADMMKLGDTFNWVLTVKNGDLAGKATFSSGQTVLVDDLPSMGVSSFLVGTVVNAGGTSGTIFCQVSSQTLTCTASDEVTLPRGGSITIPVEVTPDASGTLVNPSTAGICRVDPDNRLQEINDANNDCASNSVTVIGKPTIAKAFNPATIFVGEHSTIIFTLANPNGIALTGASFTDTLSNMSISGVQTAGGTCFGASGNVFSNGEAALGFGGITIPANGSCTVSVEVTSSVVGVHPNTTSGVSTDQAPVGDPSNEATLTVNTYAKPTIAKAFNPATIFVGEHSTIIFTLANPNGIALTGAGFTDTLSNMSISGVQTAGGTCLGANGNVFSNGEAALSFGGITIPANGSCTLSVEVTSTVVGVHPNTASGVTTDQAPVGDPSPVANLTVNAYAKPTIAKAFNPATIFVGEHSTIIFTLANPNGIALTGASFTDTLGNMSISGVQSAGGTCFGASGNVFSNGEAALSFGGITIPANGSCTVSVEVTSSVVGVHPNTTSGVSSDQAPVGDPSPVANLTVNAYAKPTIVKAFNPATIFVGETSTLVFVLINPNGIALTGASFDDTLSNMAVKGDQPAGGTCVGSNTNSFTDGDTALSFSGMTLPAGGSCTLSVEVTSSVVGVHPNTASGVSTDQAPVGDPSNVATLTVNAYAKPTIVKAFSPATIFVGETSTLVFVLTNPNGIALTGASFTDTLSNMAVKGDQPAGGTCVGANSNSFLDGDTALSFSGMTLLAGGSCTVTVDVTSNMVGMHPNTASGVSSDQAPVGDPSPVANLIVLAQPTLSKRFGDNEIASGGHTSLIVTIGNLNPSAITLTAALTDTFPLGMTLYAAGHRGTCTGVTATAGLGSFSVDIGTSIPFGGCTVIVEVTSSTPGMALNIIPAGALQTTVGNNIDLAADTLKVYIPPTVTKSFSQSLMDAGDTVTLRLVLGNPAANPGALGSVMVDDTLPAGLTLKDAFFTFVPAMCGTVTKLGGTNSAAGDAAVRFSVASLAAGETCQVDMNVTSVTGGSITNTTGAPTAGGPVGLTGLPASAQLTVTAIYKLSIVKTAQPTALHPNDTVTFTVTVANAGPSAADGAVLTDPVVSGISLLGVSCDPVTGATGGAACPTSGNTVADLQGSGIVITTLPAGGQLTFLVTAQITAAAGTSVTNTATITASNESTQSSSAIVTVNQASYLLYMPIIIVPATPTYMEWGVGIGYEDMPLTASDFDYNDWNLDINATFTYLPAPLMSTMKLVFTPQAHGATYDHTFQVNIPAQTFASDGTATLTLFNQDHQVISTITTRFARNADAKYIIFPKTSDALPTFANAIEGESKIKPQQTAELVLAFDEPFPFGVGQDQLSRPNGLGLFFDPALIVLNTGEQIHYGDTRLLVVPTSDWLWPEEAVRIDRVYPNVTFVAGLPVFPPLWWTTYNNCVYDGVACTFK